MQRFVRQKKTVFNRVICKIFFKEASLDHEFKLKSCVSQIQCLQIIFEYPSKLKSLDKNNFNHSDLKFEWGRYISVLNNKQCFQIIGFMVAVIMTFATTGLTIINTINWFVVNRSKKSFKNGLVAKKPLYDDSYRVLKNPRYSDPFIGMQLGAVRLPPVRNFSDQTNSVPQQIHSIR